jgi:hypothetical protein
MKGAHASSRGSAVDSKAVIKDDSQDVARGD